MGGSASEFFLVSLSWGFLPQAPHPAWTSADTVTSLVRLSPNTRSGDSCPLFD